jgi:hypothetical protein
MCFFSEYNWGKSYCNVKKPPHALQVDAFIDTDHTDNKIIKHSQTRILMYQHCAPIKWFSKGQSIGLLMHFVITSQWLQIQSYPHQR